MVLYASVTDTQRILDSIRRLVRLLRLTDRAIQSERGLSGAQLFALGVIGEYLARMHFRTMNRPAYAIRGAVEAAPSEMQGQE